MPAFLCPAVRGRRSSTARCTTSTVCLCLEPCWSKRRSQSSCLLRKWRGWGQDLTDLSMTCIHTESQYPACCFLAGLFTQLQLLLAITTSHHFLHLTVCWDPLLGLSQHFPFTCHKISEINSSSLRTAAILVSFACCFQTLEQLPWVGNNSLG